ncbi:hypothetical protein [Flavobacterium commune]|uniref:Uncharacterized protein n=1 Tax=Flavobacterium commune TaxID=1306519 RepID=A0A1D9PAM4_9FLAO|nr:hypothetical protein [Flavobacterium commune]AOZ99619.1 hypothetical protein BIW12_09285 [Flavobacterium commune]
MSSIIANSVLNIVATFSPEDMAAFMDGLEKLQKPVVAKTKPKKIKPKSYIPSLEECMNIIRAKNSIPAQNKRA